MSERLATAKYRMTTPQHMIAMAEYLENIAQELRRGYRGPFFAAIKYLSQFNQEKNPQ